MEKSAVHYLIEALFILRDNIFYVFILAILFFSQYLSILLIEDLRGLFLFSFAIILFIGLPLFYGQFIELVFYEKNDAWFNIFRKYWLKFILISIILRAPIFMLSLIGFNIHAFSLTMTIFIEIASIYILPLALIENGLLKSIKLGIKCLLGNMKFSMPLVLMVIFSFLIYLLIGIENKDIEGQFSPSVFWLALVLVSIIIDFLVFIAASLILKEKLFTY
jgi:hypothetical protein